MWRCSQCSRHMASVLSFPAVRHFLQTPVTSCLRVISGHRDIPGLSPGAGGKFGVWTPQEQLSTNDKQEQTDERPAPSPIWCDYPAACFSPSLGGPLSRAKPQSPQQELTPSLPYTVAFPSLLYFHSPLLGLPEVTPKYTLKS